MARIYAKKHGKASSMRPFNLNPNEPWVDKSKVLAEIQALHKKGIPPSKIGAKLRDTQCVGSIRNATGMKLCHIIKQDFPEDLNSLMKKSMTIRLHLNSFKADKEAKHRLILNDSKFYRLLRYYQKKGKVSKKWKPNFAKLAK